MYFFLHLSIFETLNRWFDSPSFCQKSRNSSWHRDCSVYLSIDAFIYSFIYFKFQQEESMIRLAELLSEITKQLMTWECSPSHLFMPSIFGFIILVLIMHLFIILFLSQQQESMIRLAELLSQVTKQLLTPEFNEFISPVNSKAYSSVVCIHTL